MRSPWRFVMALLALVMALVALLTVTGGVSGLVVGVPVLALSVAGVWRSLIAGVKYSSDGIEVRNLERTSRVSWCEVAGVDTRVTPGDVLVFLRQADVVLLLASGEELWLTPLAVYSLSSTPSRRVEARADALRTALELHRGEHAACG